MKDLKGKELLLKIQNTYKKLGDGSKTDLNPDDDTDLKELEDACKRVISSQLLKFIDGLQKPVKLLPLVINNIITMNELADSLYDEEILPNLIKDKATVKVLKQKLELRYKFLECGWTDEKNASDLLDSICEQHQNMLSFRALTYELLSNYLSKGEEYQKEIIEGIWMEGNDLKKKIKEYNLPLKCFDKLKYLGITKPDQLTKDSMKKLIQWDKTETDERLNDYKCNSEKSNAIYDDHDRFKENLTKMVKKESTQAKEEEACYEENLKKQKEDTDKWIKQVQDMQTDVEKDKNYNKEMINTMLKNIKSQFKTDWKIEENKLENRPGEVLKQMLEELKNRKEQLKLGEAYKMDEDVVERISGGMALCGINLTGPQGLSKKIEHPLLSRPAFCRLDFPALRSAQNSVTFTSLEMSDNFKQTINSSGLTIATKMSASVAALFHASMGFGWSSEESSNLSQQKIEQSKLAYCIHYVSIPIKSFQICTDEMKLSGEAERELSNVDTRSKAESFLKKYGSHLNDGKQHVGGIFIRTITVQSEEKKKIKELEKMAGKHISASAGAGFDCGKVGAAAGGSVEHSSGQGSKTGIQEIDEKTTATTNIECIGPSCSDPDSFRDLLYGNNSSWHIIDRGSSFIPIWRVILQQVSCRPEIEKAAKLLQQTWLLTAKLHSSHPLIKTTIIEEMKQLNDSE